MGGEILSLFAILAHNNGTRTPPAPSRGNANRNTKDVRHKVASDQNKKVSNGNQRPVHEQHPLAGSVRPLAGAVN